MKTTRIHGSKSTAMLLGASGLCGYLAFEVLTGHYNEEAKMWGLGLAAFAALCLYSGFRGKS